MNNKKNRVGEQVGYEPKAVSNDLKAGQMQKSAKRPESSGTRQKVRG